MSEQTAAAVKAIKEGMNCCQAIITSYGPSLGLTFDATVKLGSAFGGGLGRTGEVCGALTGATMVLGLKYGPLDAKNPKARDRVYALTQELLANFRRRRGEVTCRKLLNCDISSADGYAKAIDSGLLKNLCPLLVQDAAEILEGIMVRETK